MADARWPNLFVVGASKAGTTALWKYLGEHPDIFMSRMKEPQYFAHHAWGHPVKDERSYLRLFAPGRNERYRGDASPSYLWPEHVPAAIHDVSPGAAILISLREPVERAYSVYLNVLRRGIEQRSFEQAVREELRDGSVNPDRPPYLQPYAPAVARYLDAFGDRVLVFFLENLAVDPRATGRRVFDFLDLDPAPADRFDPRPINEFASPRSRLIDRVVDNHRALRVARRVVPRPLRDPIYRALMPPTTKPEADPSAVLMAREAYEDDVAALRKLLDRPLPEAWERRFHPQRPAASR